MSEYSVNITERAIGIAFISIANDKEDENLITDVIENSIGERLGISVGDTLTKLNDLPITQIKSFAQYTSKDIQHIFYHQKLPFKASFRRFHGDNPTMLINDKDDFIQKVIYQIDITQAYHSDSDTQSESTTINEDFTPSLDAYSPATPITETNPYANIIHISDTYTDKNNSQHVEKKDFLDTDMLNENDKKNVSSQELIKNYVSQKNDAHFDKIIESNNIICIMSSNSLNKGCHEWYIKILQCNTYRQEIGVIGTCDIDNIELNKGGIKYTEQFKSRAIYGNESYSNSVYYGSYNENGTERCFRDLENNFHIIWKSGDIIKVCVDLNKWKIKFFLNDEKVRKDMSLEHDKIYYPVILLSNGCVYELISMK
eukprot:74546_1